METKQSEITEVLNDLLKINNDRIEGYETASNETTELDLKALFLGMADESRKHANELTRHITKLNGEPASGSTTTSGKIYRMWMEVKTSFTGKDRQSVLNSCEYGEDAAQSAYREALASNDLTLEIREMIRNQQASLKASHDVIKNFRDTEKKYQHR